MDTEKFVIFVVVIFIISIVDNCFKDNKNNVKEEEDSIYILEEEKMCIEDNVEIIQYNFN